MTETKSVNTIARQRVEDLAERGAEPSWLRTYRLTAWEAYLQVPLPTLRDEEWRHTDIGGLDLEALNTIDLGPVSDNQQALPDWLKTCRNYFGQCAGLLSQSSHAPGHIELSAKLANQGVILTDMKTALAQHAELLKPYLERSSAKSSEGKFDLLNNAMFNCGLFLYVPAGLDISEPFISGITFGEQPGALFPKVIVIVGANSKISLVHMLNGDRNKVDSGKPSLVTSSVEMFVEPGANVSYLELNQLHENVYSIGHSQTEVKRDAQLNSLSIALGGKLTKSNIATLLNEPGARSEVLGIVLGSGEEHYNFNTIQEHNAPDTTSDINFRVALKDAASSIYQGIIQVAKAAQRTSAYQSNKNLLLGGKARADSIPRLEILADDVKCSHGATVGPVDPEQIFYFNSRGLTSSQSEELIVLGFFQQVLERSSVATATGWLAEIISHKIYNQSFSPPL